MIRDKYAAEIEGLLARYPDKKSAVLPLMHLAQEEYGYMSEEAMREVAGILDLDPTHVLSLAGFYSLYYEEPTGKYVLEICNDLACALRGADEFVEMACRQVGYSGRGHDRGWPVYDEDCHVPRRLRPRADAAVQSEV